jgi:hypothetical protein|tara:strand:+ start:170 stop:781 length:612 start_codon:yes stop_codon:yes gene_type:complete
MKYKLEVYGWSVEAMAHSLNNKQLEKIEILMKDNNYDELWESRSELEDIVGDLWSPDLFQMNAPLDNGSLFFTVKDENEKVVLEFEENDLGDHYENVGDVDTLFDYESYYANPDYRNDNIKHIMFIADENKGGIYEMLFDSDKEPKPEDFSVMGGGIDTPEGEWDFISRFFFKDKLLEIDDWLDNSGKSTTMEIYTQDGRVIK